MARELTKKERMAIPRHPMPARDAGERICDFDEVALRANCPIWIDSINSFLQWINLSRF